MFKKVCLAITVCFIFCFCAVLFGNESSTLHFLDTIHSSRVHENQSGNEFTRDVIEDEEIDLEIETVDTEPGNDTASTYFPTTVGSYWVYEDSDGNEFTRRAVESEEIAGEKYHAFEYEPSFENWEDYAYHIHPTLVKMDNTLKKYAMRLDASEIE